MKKYLYFCIILSLIATGLVPVSAATLEEPVVVTELPNKEDLHIYLFIGQSNMAGRGELEDSDLKTLGENVLLLNGDNKWEIAQPWYANRTGTEVLEGYNRYSNVLFPEKFQGTNPALYFAESFKKTLPEGVSLGIISNARGNSTIESWMKGYDNPSAGINSGSYDIDLFENTVLRTKEAMKTGTLKGILWLQGEGACGDTQYVDKLRVFANDLRTELGVGTEVPFVAAKMPKFIESWTTPELYNARLETFKSIEDGFDYIDIPDTTTHVGDNTHYDSPSQKIVGTQFANKIIELYGQKYISETFEDDNHGFTTGVNDLSYGTATINPVADGKLNFNINFNNINNFDKLKTPTVIKELTKDGMGIDISNKIAVIRTRFKVSAGNDNTRVYFKLNRPENEADIAYYELGQNLYSLFYISNNRIAVANGYWESQQGNVKMENVVSDTDIKGKWITLEAHLDGKEKSVDYYVAVEEDNGNITNYEALDKSLAQPKTYNVNEELTDEFLNDLTSLDRVTFECLNGTPDVADITLDYLQVHRELKYISEQENEDESYSVNIDLGVPVDESSLDNITVTTVDGNVEFEKRLSDTILTITVPAGSSAVKHNINLNGLTYDGVLLNNKTFVFTPTEKYVSENFTDGTGGFRLGTNLNATVSTSEPVIENGILKFDAPVTSDGNEMKMPTVIRDINNGKGFEMAQNKKVVLKTRIKTDTSATNARFYFKFNRPETVDELENNLDIGHNHYVLFMTRADQGNKIQLANGNWGGGNVVQARFSDYAIDGTNPPVNQWMNVEVVMDGYNKKLDFYVAPDGGVEKHYQTSWVQPYFTDHYLDPLNSFKRLTIHSLVGGGTVNMDYIQVYNEPHIAEAKINGNSKAEFLIDTGVPVDNVNGIDLYDGNGNVLSSSKEKVAGGRMVKLVADDPLNGTCSIKMTSVKSDNVAIRDRSFTVTMPENVVADNFNADNGKWFEAVSDGTYQTNSVEYENGNIKVSTSKSGSGTKARLPGITRNINGGVGYSLISGGDVIIKTRFKSNTEGARLYFKINRPETLDEFEDNADAWNHHGLFVVHNDKSLLFKINTSPTQVNFVKKFDDGSTLADALGKWIDAEIRFNTDTQTIDFKFMVDGNSKVYTKTGVTYEQAKLSDINGETHTTPQMETLKNISFLTMLNEADFEVDYVMVYKEDMIKPTEMSVVGTENAYFTYTNMSQEKEDVMYTIAVYKIDGDKKTLENVVSNHKEISPLGVLDESLKVPTVNVQNGMTYTVKCFMWDKSTLEPITDSLEMNYGL